MLDGAPAAPPEDQVAQGLIDLTQIAFRFARLVHELDPRIGGPIGAVAADIRRSVAKHFPHMAGDLAGEWVRP